MNNAEREFDIILYGATGYTGFLVAEYLLQRRQGGEAFTFALAGRNENKLLEKRRALGADERLALVIADSAEPLSIAAMAGRARVIITTTGPYQTYGEPVVAACAATGTDYVDLAGESHWIAAMLARYERDAQMSGARLVFSCGFDSAPFDLGVYFLQIEAQKRLGAPLTRVRARIRALKGGLSGGTLASGMATIAAAQSDPALGAVLADPFALTPDFSGPPQPNADQPHEDAAIGAWVGPFMMAAINTKAVHRTNYLLDHPWGEDFLYDEMLVLPGPPTEGAGAMAGFSFDPSRALQPGDGPTPEERESGGYDILFIGETADGRVLKASVQGDRDPGYGSTSKMLSEAALCLLRDVDRRETLGGAWTPAASMRTHLIERFQTHAGVRFAIED